MLTAMVIWRLFCPASRLGWGQDLDCVSHVPGQWCIQLHQAWENDLCEGNYSSKTLSRAFGLSRFIHCTEYCEDMTLKLKEGQWCITERSISVSRNGSSCHYSSSSLDCAWASLVAQWSRIYVQCSRCRFDPLEKEMAAHSSVLAWRIPRTEEPGGL